MKLQHLFVLIVGTAPLLAQTNDKKVFGFFTSWSVYARNYHIPDVPAANLTHLVYAFAKIEQGKIGLGDRYADIEKFYPGDSWAPGALRGSFRRMQLLKQQHPHLRTLISIGGANGSHLFSATVRTPFQRQVFANSICDFIVRYGFDGVDINWEEMGARNTADPGNLTLFLTELRRQLDARGQGLNKRFLLTIDVPAAPRQAGLYELAKISPLVDAMLIMAFDYFIPIANLPNPVSHMNAPLYPIPGDPTGVPYSTDFNVAKTLSVFRQANVPAAKRILGMPFYGRGYAGITGGTNGLFARYTGPTAVGTWMPGVFDYTDLLLNYVDKGGHIRYWSPAARVPYLYNAAAGVMISYDDPRSIREKAWMLRAHGLGGAMVWELSGDRTGTLIREIDRVVRRDPGLTLDRHEVRVSSPASVQAVLDAGPSRQGQFYMFLGTLSDTYPGTPMVGDLWPLNIDAITQAMLAAPNTPLFPASRGLLDANGTARPGVALGLVSTLPSSLVGLRMSVSAWVFDSLNGLQGRPSNSGDIFFRL